MIELIGTNELPNGEDIIENSSSGTNYFAKGHLSPDAAFIDGPEQDATYYFLMLHHNINPLTMEIGKH